MSGEAFKGIHVAIIMDGNGRWATAHGQVRTAGHIEGARTVRKIVEAAPDCGIGALTLYAFSADNWKRPSREVALLMRLFRRYLISEVARCVTNGVRMRIIGRRDRLPAELLRAIAGAEEATRDGRLLDLRIAVDYSSRDAILKAAKRFASLDRGSLSRFRASSALRSRAVDPETAAEREVFLELLGSVDHAPGKSREVDLLIRTGGEQRLSDFLLWECAYAELYFSRRMWPDFSQADLRAAVEDYHSRERRFGRVPAAAAGAG